MKVLFLLFVVHVLHLLYAKHHHPIPTFFEKLDEKGHIVDRSSLSYNEEIESYPRINKISRADAMKGSLNVWPFVAQNGAKVSVLWSGISDPKPNDYIAYYCPYYDTSNHYLDYIYGKDMIGWQRGYGHHEVTVYNMREPCDFKLYQMVNKTYILTATSNLLDFADGGSQAPLQGHIAMTNQPTEMRVMWTSGPLQKPPMVRYGVTKNLDLVQHAHTTNTYTKDSMCQPPANNNGFWHPGYNYNVLLENLKPNTRYYYSYGTEGHMSATANFTTPLPKGDPSPYSFIIYGDMGVSVYPQAYATAKNVREEIDENKIRFIFHHGDISYARGYAYIWEKWGWLTQPIASLVPYMVGMGNHEYDHTKGGYGRDPSGVKTDSGWIPKWFNGRTDSGGECGVPMFHRYHMPDNGNSLFWYSYDYGLVHMIMMSTEHDYSPGSRQYKWLENDLKSVDRTVTPWVLIGGHRAMYASQEIWLDYVVALNMQKLLEDLLYMYKVDIGFWAHYHSYERTCKVYKNKCVDDGIIHIVVGTAGKGRDTEGWYPKKWSLFRASDYGYGRVTVANQTSLLYEWVSNEHKEVQDHVWLHK